MHDCRRLPRNAAVHQRSVCRSALAASWPGRGRLPAMHLQRPVPATRGWAGEPALLPPDPHRPRRSKPRRGCTLPGHREEHAAATLLSAMHGGHRLARAALLPVPRQRVAFTLLRTRVAVLRLAAAFSSAGRRRNSAPTSPVCTSCRGPTHEGASETLTVDACGGPEYCRPRMSDDDPRVTIEECSSAVGARPRAFAFLRQRGRTVLLTVLAGAALLLVVLQGSGCVRAVDTPTGCGRDTDCKGPRICNAGGCMDPPPSVSAANMQPTTTTAVASAPSSSALPSPPRELAPRVGPGF
jgi:hypothetical protein